jgi:type I restriction enzyme M protein
MTIPERLQRIRDLLSLSQEELASRLNVSYATVNRWETGKSSPQRAQLVRIEQLAEEAADGGNGDEARSATLGSARRRRGVHNSAVLGNRGMEQMLWDAACSIRGQQDAPKFKEYILPLLFIKRLSDVFDDEVERLTEKFGDRETALEILEEDHSLVRFYVPPEARWAVVSGRESYEWPRDKTPKTLGEQLTATTRAIVKHNRDLAGVIDIVDYNETRNGEREISDAALKQIIEKFSDPRYRLGLQDVEPDFLGRCYEYLLRKFAEGQGQSAGEFFTPTEVGFLMAELLRPRPGEEAYDFACGSFGLLIKLQLVSRRLDPTNKVPLKLYGQELTGSTYAIACMNRIIHDMDGEVRRGDSMLNPKFRGPDHKLQKFDIVVANPMWNQPIESTVYEKDAFNRFLPNGGITSGKADWAWLQHTVTTLKDNGRAAIVLDTGAVTRGSGSKNEDKERNIRRWFVEHDLIDGVILLPDNLFYNTNAAGLIVLLAKNKPKARRGRIVLVDASSMFEKGSPKNYLTEDGVSRIAAAVRLEAAAGVRSVTVDRSTVAARDFSLFPQHYLERPESDARREPQTLLPAIGKHLASATKAHVQAVRLATDTAWPGLVGEHRLLGDSKVCVLDRGASWSKRDEAQTGGVPVVAIPNIRSDSVNYDCNVRLTRVPESKLLSKGHVLLVGSSGAAKNVGRCAMVESTPPETTAFASFVVRARAGEDMLPKYLYYLIRTGIINFESHCRKAADGKYNLQLESLRSQPILLPSKDQQLAIIERLEHVEAIHRLSAELVRDSEELLCSAAARLMLPSLDEES